MPAFNSLRTKKEFDLVYKKGKIVHGIFFSLRFLENKQGVHNSKFGIVLGLNVSKSSVIRNRKRRQIREIIRLNKEKLKKGYSIIVSPKEKILEVDYKEIEKELLELCKKAGIMN